MPLTSYASRGEVLRLQRERFITELFSSQLKFAEVLNYAKYLDEETDFITMHKTKGTSISSVIVVMEEYFWYNGPLVKTTLEEIIVNAF